MADDWGGYKASTETPEPIDRTACPLCGEPLDIKNGILHCPFDGWTGTEGDKA